jgi:DNA polymerase
MADTTREIAAEIQSCRRCPLWRGATQGVGGDGPADAALMLDRALAEAGVDRTEAYVTNAVKHFKNEPRGKRRLHKTPNAGEVAACRWWLDQERSIVRPRVIVALGATAALGVFGHAMPIMKSRGRALPLEGEAQAVVTVHPSFLLRVPDAAAKAEAYQGLVRDLATARDLLAAP